MRIRDIKTRYDFVRLINSFGWKRGVEVGVNQAEYSYHLLAHSSLECLYSVDTWTKRQRLEMARRVLSKFDKRSQIMHMSSVKAASEIEGELDFVYIDANHRRKAVQQDIAAWFPKLRIGGFFGGHDYVEAPQCGVIPAVDAFIATRPEKLHLTDEGHPSWWIIRRE